MLDIPPESLQRSSSNHLSNPTRPTLSMQRQLLKPFRVLSCALCSQRQKLNLICRPCTVSGSDSCPARPLSSIRHGLFCSNMASPTVLALRTLFATYRRFSRTRRTGSRHQCANAPHKQIATYGVTVFFDGRAPASGEILARAEEPGQQEIELGPQFTEMVFKWRAGQTKAVPRAQFADGSRGSGSRILDLLRFVEDQEAIAISEH